MMSTRAAQHALSALRRLALVALLLSWLPPASAAERKEPPTPIYEAYAHTIFQLRSEPDTASRRFHKVENREEVDVLEYGEDWCKIFVKKEFTGYAKTEWLWRFRSYDPAVAPNLQLIPIVGAATVVTPFSAAVDKYSGNTLSPGDRFAVSETRGDAVVFPMMRGEASAAPESVVFEPVAPTDTAQPGDLIAAFTTFYNETTGRDLAGERAHNIIVGCERIDGTVVESGGSFSFNAACAPYRKSNGYLLALNISKDGEGYGGGVCQVSTTLYNALLQLPVRITKWTIHRDLGVPYIPIGFDSAVGSYSDLSFINTLPYPVRIEAAPQNGVLSVFLYRTTMPASTDAPDPAPDASGAAE